MHTLDGEIGDLKTKCCQLVLQNAGQMRSSKTPGDPEKALGLTCTRSQSSREITNATSHKFSTFLIKIKNSWEQFHLRLTLFYPIYG